MSEKEDDRIARLNDGCYSMQLILNQHTTMTRDDILAGLKIALRSADYVVNSLADKSTDSQATYTKFSEKGNKLYNDVLFQKYSPSDSKFEKRLDKVGELFSELIYFICEDMIKENERK